VPVANDRNITTINHILLIVSKLVDELKEQ
jgi:hypothetical protein